MLLAAAMKAPKDEDQADKAVWDVYYANHQKKGALKHLKVADIFMGGGTTVVEVRQGCGCSGVGGGASFWLALAMVLARRRSRKK